MSELNHLRRNGNDGFFVGFMWRRFRWKCARMVSCGVLFGFLLEMSDINSVPSMGYSGVASSLAPGALRLVDLPLLLASVMTS